MKNLAIELSALVPEVSFERITEILEQNTIRDSFDLYVNGVNVAEITLNTDTYIWNDIINPKTSQVYDALSAHDIRHNNKVIINFGLKNQRMIELMR